MQTCFDTFTLFSLLQLKETLSDFPSFANGYYMLVPELICMYIVELQFPEKL